MKRAAAAGLLLACAAVACAAQARGRDGAAAPPSWIRDPAKAERQWLLQCQGCHRRDGAGDAVSVPPIAHVVGRFLSVPGSPSGRDYLARVPGIASAPLSDEDAANLLNWMIWRYDAEHIPNSFRPYTKNELSVLRSNPIRMRLKDIRARLVASNTY